MTNQFEYKTVSERYFEDDYIMKADYDMALMMKDDCIKQLMALRELHPLLFTDEFERIRHRIRLNLRDAEFDISRYESESPEITLRRSLEPLLSSAI